MKSNFFKSGILLTTITIASTFSYAQNAKEIVVDMNGQSKPAYTADYTYSKSLVQKTLSEKLKATTNSKGAKSNGYIKYEGVVLTELSPNKLDVYTKVEGKKKSPVVTMMVSTGYDNFVGTAKDPVLAANTITYLNKLKDDMQAVLDLEAQRKAVKEAEEKLKKTEKEKEKLAKQKARIEQKMAKEQQAAEQAGQKVDVEKNKLDVLKSSENNSGGR